MSRIYLDHAATSPMHPEVIHTMTSFMAEAFGNPSSIHAHGRESRRLLDLARDEIASLIGAQAGEIIFTSGGTEADNMAILGAAYAMREKGNHIITTSIEHHAVLHTCRFLEKEGFRVTYLPVDRNGVISLEDFKNELSPDTILATIMYGNNEVGSLQPISEIGAVLEGHQAVFHTDAVQAFGVLKLDVKELKTDLLSVSGHKLNGPKGIGFLYAKSGITLKPRVFGGEQELKRRAGTENAAGAAGLHKAALLAEETREKKVSEYKEMKSEMIEAFNAAGIAYDINGSFENSLPHVLNVYFPGTNVESLLVNLDIAGISASSGSACTAGSIDPSHVLTAMFGKDSDRPASSIRFSFGLGNTADQVSEAAAKIAAIVKRLTA
ncbi:aminotransferase class V-fold PLP-dependent enzyme [Bacillus mangrovi]|uniref:cysteine desulfurase n=1 Tax=Metabacillus mangrovi TaxID=1491830 RepID=A0A7X2S2M4_9BACI|nr:cysteine desulfurase family protein [Metabacillus mangrovi]MTH52534.1 aminotransferase class V-fold PLP-dependent enzyme [Metabacillus mangrovi]